MRVVNNQSYSSILLLTQLNEVIVHFMGAFMIDNHVEFRASIAKLRFNIFIHNVETVFIAIMTSFCFRHSCIFGKKN